MTEPGWLPTPDDLPELKCNGCRKCCLGDTVVLTATEENNHRRGIKKLWQVMELHDGNLALAKGPNGNCIYLGRDGCKIHDQPRPKQCEQFDCRLYVLQSYAQGLLEERWEHPLKRPVLAEGSARIRNLKVTPR